MLARAFSAAVNGIEAFPVEVAVNGGRGDSVIVIVGRIAQPNWALFDLMPRCEGQRV